VRSRGGKIEGERWVILLDILFLHSRQTTTATLRQVQTQSSSIAPSLSCICPRVILHALLHSSPPPP
jgi:hypothetical protein